MQKIDFQTGGFVIHKIIIAGYNGRFSAWFLCDGSLSDFEFIHRNGRSYRVGAAAQDRLKIIGKVWAPK